MRRGTAGSDDGSRGAARVDRARTRPEGGRMVRSQRARGALARGARTRCHRGTRGEPGSRNSASTSSSRGRRAHVDVPLEADQEDFLVLAGQALLIVEGERPCGSGTVHRPAGTTHDRRRGDRTTVVLAVGAREHQTGADWGDCRSTKLRSATTRASRTRRTTRNKLMRRSRGASAARIARAGYRLRRPPSAACSRPRVHRVDGPLWRRRRGRGRQGWQRRRGQVAAPTAAAVATVPAAGWQRKLLAAEVVAEAPAARVVAEVPVAKVAAELWRRRRRGRR